MIGILGTRNVILRACQLSDSQTKGIGMVGQVVRVTSIRQKRNRFGIFSATTIGISVGGGDAAQYTVDNLIALIRPAAIQFTDTVWAVVHFYTELIQEKHTVPF